VLIDIPETRRSKHGRQFSGNQHGEDLWLRQRLGGQPAPEQASFTGNVRDAQKLRRKGALSPDLERAYATSHLGRLCRQHAAGQETSSRRPISDFKRINSSARSPTDLLDSAGPG
jgi:phosphate:Na+ symporter